MSQLAIIWSNIKGKLLEYSWYSFIDPLTREYINRNMAELWLPSQPLKRWRGSYISGVPILKPKENFRFYKHNIGFYFPTTRYLNFLYVYCTGDIKAVIWQRIPKHYSMNHPKERQRVNSRKYLIINTKNSHRKVREQGFHQNNIHTRVDLDPDFRRGHGVFQNIT